MNKRIVIDILMTVLMPLLMAYSLIGETFHEIAGIIAFVLFIIHHFRNRGWYKAVNKGKYDSVRIFRTVINTLLLIFMILQPVTGIIMSKQILVSLTIPGFTATARSIHLVLAYWGFVLLSLHAGTHMEAPLKKLRSSKPDVEKGLRSAAAVVSLYGIYAFMKRGFLDYMFLRQSFAFIDTNEPLILFVMDYISIMILFGTAGYLIIQKLRGMKDERN